MSSAQEISNEDDETHISFILQSHTLAHDDDDADDGDKVNVKSCIVLRVMHT